MCALIAGWEGARALLVRTGASRMPRLPPPAPLGHRSWCMLFCSGIAAGVPWAEYRVKLVLAGEVFSEEWRTLMAQR